MALFTDERVKTPNLRNPPPELRQGVRAVKESMDMGEITEEEGNALIAYMYSAWIEAALSNMVMNYLDRSVARSLSKAAQSME